MIRRSTVEEMAPLVIEPTEPPPDGGVPWIYCLESKVQWTIPRIAPDRDFTDAYDGEILRRRMDLPTEIAGRFLAIRIRVDDAREAGTRVRDIIDAYGTGLVPYYRALFSPKTDDLKPSIRERFVLVGPINILVIYSVLVLPQHRGRCLGLATASRLIETLGGGCSLVVCRPVAAQFCRPIPDRQFHDAMRLGDFTQDPDAAIRRLRRHVRQLGFRRVHHSDVFAVANDPGWIEW